MATLPTPGGDTGTWGDELNTYLSVQHNADGSHKSTAAGQVIVDQATYGGGTVDTTAHVQALIDSVSITTPRRGGHIVFPPGRYQFDSALTLPSNGRGWKISGVGGTTATAGGVTADFGAVLEFGSASMTLFNFDGGASNQQSIPTFQDIAFDGKGLASTVAIACRLANRLSCDKVHFANLTTGVYLNSSVDSVSGGDSAWHQFDNCHFNLCTIGIEARHSFGVQVNGGTFVGCTRGIHWKSVTGTDQVSQWLRLFGPKFDGGSYGIDQEGGHGIIWGCAFENVTVAPIKLSKTSSGTGSAGLISGGKQVIGGCGFGGVPSSACIEIGTGCGHQLTILPNYYTNSGTTRAYADDTARQTTLDFDHGNWGIPVNMPLGSMRTTTPADALLPMGGAFQIYANPTTGKLVFKMKKGDGTFTTQTITSA